MSSDAPEPETHEPEPPAPVVRDEVSAEISRRTRRSFLVGAVATVAGYAGFKWVTTRREDDGISWPLRRALEVNEGVAEEYFSSTRLAPTFPASAAGALRPNGDIGMTAELDASAWRLRLENVHDVGSVELTMDDLRALPRTEMITEFKCVEGWSQVVAWAGVRLADVMRAYPPYSVDGDPPDVSKPDKLPRYVALETPDGGYYVGLDVASAVHPQTLLSYEINGEVLPVEHGAPLRLTIPLKYGIKNIKRIGLIRYTDRRPRDFWAEQGYDYYAGH